MAYPLQSDDTGKLILRLMLGGLMLLHGIHKMQDPGAMVGIGKQLTAAGLPAFIAYGAYIGEVLAPLMLILGIFTRIGSLLIMVNMIFAILLAHSKDILMLGEHGGWKIELQGFYLFTAIALYFLGSGRFAVKPD
jgi:putative oxidoreductase